MNVESVQGHPEHELLYPADLQCPTHGTPVRRSPQDATSLTSSCGCSFPVRNGIPRFVPPSTYADGFGLQWKTFRRTQLDSYTGTTISRDRLARCVGESLDPLRGARILEVGCGAGRFTEILQQAGADVAAMDLSEAVDANFANSARTGNYFVCQADAFRPPFPPGAFDYVIALGMLQHTPSPEETIGALAKSLKPGGVLVIDHYARPSRLVSLLLPFQPRTWLRVLFLHLRPDAALRWTRRLVSALLPLHRVLWHSGRGRRAARAVLRRISPVFDYYDSHPQLGPHLEEWAILDTHDALTDRYKHLRSVTEIRACLEGVGLEVLSCREAGNGIEARGRRP